MNPRVCKPPGTCCSSRSGGAFPLQCAAARNSSSSSSSSSSSRCSSSKHAPITSQQHEPATQSSTSRSPSFTASSNRRLVLQSTFAPLLVPAVLGSNDTTTILNSVLSAYGLPTLKASSGYSVYDEFKDDYTFEYPRAWVSRPNSQRAGVIISDFQTADKVAVEELDIPTDGDLTSAAVVAVVLPGSGRLTQDDVLSLPPKRLIKSSTQTLDGQEYLYLEFPSETITRSGYQIVRKNFVAAAAKKGKLYIIAASARGDQYNERKKELLQHVVQSFRLR